METVACLLEFKQRMMLKSPALSSHNSPLYLLCVCPIILYYKAYFPPNLKIIADVRHEA